MAQDMAYLLREERVPVRRAVRTNRKRAIIFAMAGLSETGPLILEDIAGNLSFS